MTKLQQQNQHSYNLYFSTLSVANYFLDNTFFELTFSLTSQTLDTVTKLLNERFQPTEMSAEFRKDVWHQKTRIRRLSCRFACRTSPHLSLILTHNFICMYTVRQKKEPIFFCMHLFKYPTESDIFFTYIRLKESMSISCN